MTYCPVARAVAWTARKPRYVLPNSWRKHIQGMGEEYGIGRFELNMDRLWERSNAKDGLLRPLQGAREL